MKCALMISVAGLGLSACATTQEVRVKGEVTNEKAATARKVIVLPDPSMEDPAKAQELVGLVKNAFTSRGYKLVSTEQTADLVVLPFFTSVEPQMDSSSSRRFQMARAMLFDGGRVGPGTITGNSIGMYDLQGAVPPESKVGLMVAALSAKTWSTLTAEGEDMPPIWKVTATTTAPVGKEEKYPTALVDAAMPYFGKQTAGEVIVKLKSPQ